MTSTGICLFALGQIISVPFYIMAIKRIKDMRLVNGVVTEAIPEDNNEGYRARIKTVDNIEFQTSIGHYVEQGMKYRLAVSSKGNIWIFDGYIWEFGVPMIMLAGTLPLLML